MGRSELGKKSEAAVVGYFLKKGFDILAQNYATSFGEVDIIAKRAGAIYLVEVRSGRSNFAQNGSEYILQSVTREKLRKIMKTGLSYLARHRMLDLDMSILMASVTWYNSDRCRIEMVPVD